MWFFIQSILMVLVFLEVFSPVILIFGCIILSASMIIDHVQSWYKYLWFIRYYIFFFIFGVIWIFFNMTGKIISSVIICSPTYALLLSFKHDILYFILFWDVFFIFLFYYFFHLCIIIISLSTPFLEFH